MKENFHYYLAYLKKKSPKKPFRIWLDHIYQNYFNDEKIMSKIVFSYYNHATKRKNYWLDEYMAKHLVRQKPKNLFQTFVFLVKGNFKNVPN